MITKDTGESPGLSIAGDKQQACIHTADDLRRLKELAKNHLSQGEQDKPIPELLAEIQHAEQKSIVAAEEDQEQEAAEEEREKVARTRQDKKSKADSQELLASKQEAKKLAKLQKQRQLATASELQSIIQTLDTDGSAQRLDFDVSTNTFADTCVTAIEQTSQTTINAESGPVSGKKTQTFVEGCNGEMSADKAARNKKEKSSLDKNGQANDLAKQGTAAQKNDPKTQQRVTSIYASGYASGARFGMFELPPEGAPEVRSEFQAGHVRSEKALGKVAADTGESSAQKHTPDDSPNNAPRAG